MTHTVYVVFMYSLGVCVVIGCNYVQFWLFCTSQGIGWRDHLQNDLLRVVLNSTPVIGVLYVGLL